MQVIVGNIVGFITLIFFFWSYQVKDKDKLLIVLSGAVILTCVQYLILGAYAGFALNAVCLVRNVFYSYRDKKCSNSPVIPVVFACILPVVSLMSWDGPISLFVIAGLMINTLCLGLCSADGVRKSILITSPMIIIYNFFTMAYSGILNEAVAIASSIIGILRFSKEKKGENK